MVVRRIEHPGASRAEVTERFDGPLAVLADVHGNLAALQAVVAQCRAQYVGAYFVAGDLLYPGDDPLGVWRLLTEVRAHCVRGSSDLALATVDPATLRPRDAAQRQAAERFRETRARVGELVLARLRALPTQLRVDLGGGRTIAVVHGAPADPTEVITHDLDDDEVARLLGRDPPAVVACGGSHVAFDRTVRDVRVVGVGSVGESPDGRVAHYALLDPGVTGIQVEPRWVAY